MRTDRILDFGVQWCNGLLIIMLFHTTPLLLERENVIRFQNGTLPRRRALFMTQKANSRFVRVLVDTRCPLVPHRFRIPHTSHIHRTHFAHRKHTIRGVFFFVSDSRLCSFDAEGESEHRNHSGKGQSLWELCKGLWWPVHGQQEQGQQGWDRSCHCSRRWRVLRRRL